MTRPLAAAVFTALSHDTASAAPPAPPSAAYKIFDRGAATNDAGPANASAIGASRQVRALVPGASEWVRASSDEVCITGEVPTTRVPGQLTPPSACTPADAARTNGGVVTLTSAYTHAGTTTYSVLGVVPDGTNAVVATLADGTTQAVPVSDNGIQLEAAQDVVALTVTNQNANTTTISLGDHQ